MSFRVGFIWIGLVRFVGFLGFGEDGDVFGLG